MNLIIDREKFAVVKDGKEIYLPPKEFEVLWLLCSVPGKVFSREIIFEKIWGRESSSKGRTVDVHITNIRNKLSDTLIRNIKGVGYKVTVSSQSLIVQ